MELFFTYLDSIYTKRLKGGSRTRQHLTVTDLRNRHNKHIEKTTISLVYHQNDNCWNANGTRNLGRR